MEEHIEAALTEAGARINALVANERRLLDKLSTARKDADRYRRLRDGNNWPAVFARHDAPEPLRGVELDAACDGAA